MPESEKRYFSIKVPNAIAPAVEGIKYFEVETKTPQKPEGPKLDIVQWTHIVVFVTSLAGFIKAMIEIHKLLQTSNNPGAKALVDSKKGERPVEISATDTQDDVRRKAEKVYGQRQE